MAERLESFDFKKRRQGSQWDEWLDGSTWRLTKGEDFNCSATELRVRAISAAKYRGKKVHTSVDGDSVVIQAYEPKPDGESP